jgi:hypothetical protein
MNVGEFKTMLRDSHKRGTSLDSQLNNFLRRASRWIEQNYSLFYMRRRIHLTSTAGEDTIILPTSIAIKSIALLRYRNADGTLGKINKIDMEDEDWVPGQTAYGIPSSTIPSAFSLNGSEELIFNARFSNSVDLEGIMIRYTDWPQDDDKTHWLLNNAEGLMLRQSMIEVSTYTRNADAYAVFLRQREEDVKVLLNADYEARYAGQDIFLTA